MRAHWVVLASLAWGGCFPKGWPPERPGFSIHDFDYDAGPYLVRLSDSRMAVVVMHDLSAPPVVRWWARPERDAGARPEMTEVRAIRNDDLWVAIMRDLPADTPLRYSLESELGLVGPFDFHAQRSREKPFRFAAIGDTRTGHQVHRALVERLAKEEVDFFINSGDLVEFGGQLDLWIRFFNIEAPLMSKTPMFASVGNHDNSQPLYFRRLFLSDMWAEGNRYYYQDWGRVRLVALDSEIEIRPGSDQYGFMEKALRDGAEKGQLIVLSLHYPPYSSGEHGSNPTIRAVLAPLCKKYGVEVVLAGHDHDYERTKPLDGTTYLVAASAGAPIRRVEPQDFTAVFRTEPHYVLFDVEEDRLVGRTVNLEGEVFDTFIVPALAPEPAL